MTITTSLPTALSISTPTLSNGVLNQPYNQTVLATNGSGPRTWSFQGGTIPNLSINSLTGVISGNPTPTGNFTFTVQVTDTLFTATKQFTIAVTPPPAPSINSPASLPVGTVNTPYPSTTLTATGGAAPLAFQPVGMPFGLTFTPSTGAISGTPTSSGTSNVTFTVNDSTVPFNQTGSRTYTITVNAALTLDTPSLISPSGTVGQIYGPVQLAASGGVPPYTWSITGTGTPDQAAPGLTLSSAGVISGTPSTAVGSPFTRTYRVQDSNGTAVIKSLTLNVSAGLTIDTLSPLPSGKVGDAYGTVTPSTPVTLTASGGTPPYTWSTTVTPPLPTGLSINAAGTISGTPTVSETSVAHQFTVSDSTTTGTAVKILNLTIAP